MRKFIFSIVVIFLIFFLASAQHNKNENITANKSSVAQVSHKLLGEKTTIHINNAIIFVFFKKYSNLKTYQSDVNTLYKKRNYKTIWLENKGLIEFAGLLYSKVNLLNEEGVESNLVYKDEIDGIFNSELSKNISQTDTELMYPPCISFMQKKNFMELTMKKLRKLSGLYHGKIFLITFC